MKITNRFKKVIKDLHKNVDLGIQEWEKAVKDVSQNYVPTDTGALKDSYKAEKTKDTKDQIEYTIQYGDGLQGSNGDNYAAEVHEMPAYNQFTTPGTGPRYLERAMKELKGLLVKYVKQKAGI